VIIYNNNSYKLNKKKYRARRNTSTPGRYLASDISLIFKNKNETEQLYTEQKMCRKKLGKIKV